MAFVLCRSASKGNRVFPLSPSLPVLLLIAVVTAEVVFFAVPEHQLLNTRNAGRGAGGERMRALFAFPAVFWEEQYQ